MQTCIIHVSTNVQRGKHILKEIEKIGNRFIFINDGDVKDLTPAILDQYFTGELMHRCSAATSCAYKHLLVYNRLIASNEDIVLILEDDIQLYRNFGEKLNAAVQELETRKLYNYIVSLEDSSLRYVPSSQRRKGQLLYPMSYQRTTAAYIIDRAGAESLLRECKQHKMDLPIDMYHDYCIQNNIIQMYWRQPAIACQKTLNGTFKSLIDGDSKKHGLLRYMGFELNKVYKKILYWFR